MTSVLEFPDCYNVLAKLAAEKEKRPWGAFFMDSSRAAA
jgi:hypothetical protein